MDAGACTLFPFKNGDWAMQDIGASVTNPRTGTDWEVIELEETRFVLRYTIPAGVSQPEIAAHYHVGWHEEFRVREGQGKYRLDGTEHPIAAGETVALPEVIRAPLQHRRDPDGDRPDRDGAPPRPETRSARRSASFSRYSSGRPTGRSGSTGSACRATRCNSPLPGGCWGARGAMTPGCRKRWQTLAARRLAGWRKSWATGSSTRSGAERRRCVSGGRALRSARPCHDLVELWIGREVLRGGPVFGHLRRAADLVRSTSLST